VSETLLFSSRRRTGPLDSCERLALARFQAAHPRPMLAREAIEPADCANAAEFNLGCLRLQARGWIRARRRVSWELTRRIAEGCPTPQIKAPQKSVPSGAQRPARGNESKMTPADVLLLLGRTLLHRPGRSADDIASDPGPFDCLILLAEAAGFDQTGVLLRAIARADMVRAYWLATAAAGFIHDDAMRAILKHFEMKGLLAESEPRRQRGAR
jgi:hypothetical protein